MESTGTYWQSLFSTLVGQGFEVMLAGRPKHQRKNNKHQGLSMDSEAIFLP